ncbi:MAG TPA: FAD-dependent oxidoreductase [Candidatus Acidoferrales bacterium]|nr:FAD-dependent oxidoreductase [Candidatus Acidoferrales bacterium]
MTGPSSQALRVDVLVAGGGPAGLAAAIELRRLGTPRVLVVDREEQAGGIPRHAAHVGFGLRDMHRLLTGPRYAARYVHLAERAGVEMRIATSVTGWSGAGTVSLTSPAGLTEVTASAIVLATGCRERPRAARLVPGGRPLGVFTTGALQQLVYLHHQPVGRRAVVIGAEHVSFSAVLTLAHAGARTVAMITEHPRHQSYLPYKWLSATRLRVPILTSSRVTEIVGRKRVEAVQVTDTQTGAVRVLECDTVVFTGDWMPDHELARRGGLVMDPATRAPRVDCGLRTSVRGVFAAGNLLHAAETADVAALSGRHAARAAHTFLTSGNWPDEPPLPIQCEPPLLWVSPSAIGPHPLQPPHGHFILRAREYAFNATLVVRQAQRGLWRCRVRRLIPNLPIHVPAAWVAELDPRGEAVTFSVER